MADEISIRMRVDGDAQVNSALGNTAKNIDRINSTLRGQNSTLKASGQAFNQFGNLVRSFGSNELANLTNQIEASIVGIRSMNHELGNSKVAYVAMGAAAIGAGIAIGNSIRKFVPIFKEPDALESSMAANLKALQIAEKINALKRPETSGTAALGTELRSIDQQIKEIQDKAFGLFGIKGFFNEGVTTQDQNLILQLERLKEALKKVNDEAKVTQTLEAFRFGEGIKFQNDMRGTPDQRLAAQIRQETDRLDALLSSEKFKEAERLIKERQADVPQDATMSAPTKVFNLREQAYQDSQDRIATISKNWYDGERGRAEALAAKEKADRERRIQGVSDMFGNLATVAASFGKKGFAAYKAFAIAQATVDTYLGAVKAATAVYDIPYVGPYLAVVAAAAAVAAGLANIAKIQSQSAPGGAGYMTGGYTGNIPTGQVAGQVHGQEYVVDAASTRRLGVQNIQDFVSTGGSSSSQATTVESSKVSNYILFDESALRSMMKSRAFSDGVVNVVRVRKMEVGIA